jgi:hypothetical protein
MTRRADSRERVRIVQTRQAALWVREAQRLLTQAHMALTAASDDAQWQRERLAIQRALEGLEACYPRPKRRRPR